MENSATTKSRHLFHRVGKRMQLDTHYKGNKIIKQRLGIFQLNLFFYQQKLNENISSGEALKSDNKET